MSTATHVPNVPQISDDAAVPTLHDVIERSKVTKSPPPAWYRTMGQNPEVAVEFARYWDMLHRGGTVPHEIKELARIQIAQIVGCEFCARQTSPLASITQEEKLSCAKAR
jgi:alkylhydroperoxidase family enzyme